MHSNIDVPVPACFVALEQHFGPSIPKNVRPDDAPDVGKYVALAGNLCRRLGDVEYYVKLITDELDSKRGAFTAKAVSSLLVGYFSACKGVLDAGAMALANLYSLGLKSRRRELVNKEMDFARQGKGSFWAALASEQPAVHRRFTRFTGTFGEVFEWRDAAIHRIHPLVITQMRRDAETGVAHIDSFGLVLDADPAFSKLWNQKNPWKTTDPLHFHKKWQPQLVEFCTEVCQDIIGQSAKRIVVPKPLETAAINAALIDHAIHQGKSPKATIEKTPRR